MERIFHKPFKILKEFRFLKAEKKRDQFQSGSPFQVRRGPGHRGKAADQDACGFFLPLKSENAARTALMAHQPAHTARSEKEPWAAAPTRAASPNRMIRAILPPFFSEFLVTMDTIPPASIKTATIMPAEPETSPFSERELARPAAQD